MVVVGSFVAQSRVRGGTLGFVSRGGKASFPFRVRREGPDVSVY